MAVQIATSAMLKIAGKPQICRKSTTCPMPKLGSRKRRSVTLPSAPPSSRPSIQAHAVDLMRLAKKMMATMTPTATIDRIQVNPLATKTQIKAAVEELFPGVRVEGVRTQVREGKKRRFRQGVGQLPTWKKAIVTLNEEDKIEFF